MENLLPDNIVLVRLLLALILGAVIGLEREIHGREAGFRTHILVTIGATLITMVSIHFGQIGSTSDTSRIAAQIVSGIGFLGAGAIIRFGAASIKGLTTAASLWAMAGVGMAIGSGFYTAGSFASVLIFLSLFVLSRIDRTVTGKKFYYICKVTTKSKQNLLPDIKKIFSNHDATLKSYNALKTDTEIVFEIHTTVPHRNSIDNISDEMLKNDGITQVNWIT